MALFFLLGAMTVSVATTIALRNTDTSVNCFKIQCVQCFTESVYQQCVRHCKKCEQLRNFKATGFEHTTASSGNSTIVTKAFFEEGLLGYFIGLFRGLLSKLLRFLHKWFSGTIGLGGAGEISGGGGPCTRYECGECNICGPNGFCIRVDDCKR